MESHPTDVPCPPSPSLPIQGEQSKCSQQVVEVTYWVKLAIKVKAAGGGWSGRFGGWRAQITLVRPDVLGELHQNNEKILPQGLGSFFCINFWADFTYQVLLGWL